MILMYFDSFFVKVYSYKNLNRLFILSQNLLSVKYNILLMLDTCKCFNYFLSLLGCISVNTLVCFKTDFFNSNK